MENESVKDVPREAYETGFGRQGSRTGNFETRYGQVTAFTMPGTGVRFVRCPLTAVRALPEFPQESVFITASVGQLIYHKDIQQCNHCGFGCTN